MIRRAKKVLVVCPCGRQHLMAADVAPYREVDRLRVLCPKCQSATPRGTVPLEERPTITEQAFRRVTRWLDGGVR